MAPGSVSAGLMAGGSAHSWIWACVVLGMVGMGWVNGGTVRSKRAHATQNQTHTHII